MATTRRLARPELPDYGPIRERLQAERNGLVTDQDFYQLEGWQNFEKFLGMSYEIAQLHLETEGTTPARSEFLRGRIHFIKDLLRLAKDNEAKLNQNSARFEELRLQEEEYENG